MKYAITGHTSGVGKALYDHYFPNAVGFSRSNGYDISKDKENIIKQSVDCDVFINNAHESFFQIELLYELSKTFKGKIINISSNSGDGIKNYSHMYAIQKNALDKANEQLYYQGVNTTNLRFGWIDTPKVQDVEETKMSTKYCISIVDWLLEQPHRVKEITITP